MLNGALLQHTVMSLAYYNTCELCPGGAEEEDSVVEDNLNIGVIFSPSHFYSGCARRQGNLSLHSVRVCVCVPLKDTFVTCIKTSRVIRALHGAA